MSLNKILKLSGLFASKVLDLGFLIIKRNVRNIEKDLGYGDKLEKGLSEASSKARPRGCEGSNED